MKRRLVILARAQQDVDDLYCWIAARSRDGAMRWYQAYHAAVMRMRETPESYALADENDEISDREIRQFSFKTRRGRTFRGVFTIVGDEVHVLRIRGPGQAPLTADELNL